MKKTWLWWIPPAIFALLSRLPDFIYWFYKPEDLYGFFNKTLSFISSIADPIWSALATVFSWVWTAVSFTVPVPLSLLILATIVFAWLLNDLYRSNQPEPEPVAEPKPKPLQGLNQEELLAILGIYDGDSDEDTRHYLKRNTELDDRMIDQLFEGLFAKGYITNQRSSFGVPYCDLTRKGRDEAIEFVKELRASEKEQA